MVWLIRKKGGVAKELTAGTSALQQDFPVLSTPPNPMPEPATEVKEMQRVPLFIKVDRYKELLSYLGALKGEISTLKQLGDVLTSAQETFVETNSALNASLDKANKLISAVEAELGRPQGIDIDIEVDPKRTEMKISLTELKTQLDKLKSEVKAISA
ncbi:MAG: hypothetical protein V1836_03240 [Candidatus Aenigmatarchaeota archaeon]